jgi:hypothetical protein
MRAEFARDADGKYQTLAELQEALDTWVADYNTRRPHQSCGGRPPAERFRLAARPVALDESAAAQAAAASAVPAKQRPAGVSRWVNAHGKISLGGFTYTVGASYAGEPVEVVVAGGLVDILHAGVVVITHAQRFRDDQADRAPRARVARRARDATAGVTVTRLADAAGVVSFAGTPYAAGRRWARQQVDVSIVAGSVQLSRDGKVIRVHPIRHDRGREPGAFANPKGRPRRKNSAIGNTACPVPLAGAAAQHPGPPLPRQGPAVAARRPAAALDERASTAPPGKRSRAGHKPARASTRPPPPAPAPSRPKGQTPMKGRFAAHYQTAACGGTPRLSRPAGKELSPSYRNSPVARVPELDTCPVCVHRG